MKNDLLKIINNYGVSHQLKKLSEEIFEFQEAVNDLENYERITLEKAEEVHIEHIEEEFADVMNVMEQFKSYYELDNDHIIKTMKNKIKRQNERMKNEVS